MVMRKLHVVVVVGRQDSLFGRASSPGRGGQFYRCGQEGRGVSDENR